MKISFLIPVYNEEKRVSKAITALEKYLKKINFSYEVIFVDDGSTDKTIAKINSLKPKFKFRLISYHPNRGKGYAIKRGMLTAVGDYILFFDVDMSTPLTEFDKFIIHLQPGVVLIGNRKGKGAQILKHQPFIREKMGQMFTLLAQFVVAPEVSDFTCGFKCFPASVAKKVFAAAQINRWSYDAEILFLTRQFGFKIQEVPVKWVDDPRTRVTLLKDSLQSLTDLFKIKVWHFLGKYK